MANDSLSLSKTIEKLKNKSLSLILHAKTSFDEEEFVPLKGS